MTKPWIMDSRARASKKYIALHEQLAHEVAADRERKTKSPKRIRKHVRSELHRMFADNV